MKTLEETKYGLGSHGYEICDKRCAYHDWRGTGYDCSSMLCQDALAHIEKLEAQIPRWIPVEERLPEAEVLAANFQPGTYGYTDLIIGYVTSREQGCFAENEHELLHSVTHWMPLPEPPKEE